MSLRNQALIGGMAVLAALSYLLYVSAPRTSGGDSGPASGGYYDERGHWIVPIPPHLQDRLKESPPPHPREQAIVDSVHQKIRNKSPEQIKEIARTLSPGLRYVWTTVQLESYVNNGGFRGYFDGVGMEASAPGAAAAFRAMGGEDFARLIEQALAIRLKNPDRSDLYEPIEEAFYRLEETRPPSRLRASYIDAHPDEFPQ
jgi:hypothetical protein